MTAVAETKRGTYLASVSRDVRRCFAHKDPRATGCTPSQRRRRASRTREGASPVAGSHARQVQTPALARPVRPLERGASVIPVSDRETDSDARRATAARGVAGAIPDTRRGCRRARRPRRRRGASASTTNRIDHARKPATGHARRSTHVSSHDLESIAHRLDSPRSLSLSA